MRPPDQLVKQLSVYTEEKFEDEEDLRERSLSQAHNFRRAELSPSQAAFDRISEAARQHDVFPDFVQTLKHWSLLLEGNQNRFESREK